MLYSDRLLCVLGFCLLPGQLSLINTSSYGHSGRYTFYGDLNNTDLPNWQVHLQNGYLPRISQIIKI